VTSFGSFDAGPTIVGFAGTWFNTAPVDRLGHPSDHLLAEINGTSFNFRTLLGSPGNGFLGFVDPSGFSSISLTDDPSPNGLRFSLDDARIATEVSSGNVPEPATLLLFGTGLAAAGVQRFRRKR
jgi:hypothetical protein